MIEIYTDGACSKNGRECARAAGAYLINKLPINFDEAITGSIVVPLEEKQTNQVAELYGILYALKFIIEQYDYKNADFVDFKGIKIYSDSAYAIGCLSTWVNGWIGNGWINSKKQPVENQAIIKEIYSIMEELRNNYWMIEFEKVKGHSGVEFNEIVDDLARKAISKEK